MSFSELAANLATQQNLGLYRYRRIIDSPQGTVLQSSGQILLNFCSNDYLGLANHPAVIKAFKNAVERYGVGSGSAHLICGHSSAHHALEEELADFTGRERALIFSTGYMANLGAINSLLQKNDLVLEDRLNHASLLDGGLSSGAAFKRYGHVDMAQLGKLLEKPAANKLIVTDGVFSMDGDFAPLDQLARLAKKHDAWLMVDDAHGFGVFGKQGRGMTDYFQLGQNEVPVLMGTLGKSFGTFGAFIAGSETLIETLIQKARSYIYTTALPPAIAQATRTSLKLLMAEDWRREKLLALIKQFQLGAGQLGLKLMPSPSAIQPIIMGDSQAAVKLSDSLLQHGILVSAIRPPTVPQGSARLRITFSANHEPQHIDRLLSALENR
ncbi:MAG: 8-amino-7-oxononanoate synthase [Methylococcaceae bacterium]|jgi:8-amino-7-oxononanoate synthase